MYTTSHQYIVLSGTLWSRGKPHLWANNPSFRVVTTDDRACTPKSPNESCPVLVEIESFRIEPWSPDICHILLPDSLSNFRFGSRSAPHLGCLSERIQSFGNHRFSSDGSLFTAYSFRGIDIWKYTSGRLTFNAYVLPRGGYSTLRARAPSTSPLFYFH